MNESPFEHTSLDSSASNAFADLNKASTPAADTTGFEIRYPVAQRIVVPTALVAMAFVTPAVVFFIVQPPLNLMLAILMAVVEFSTAGFMWFLFNSYLVRLDKNGVTKSQIGQTKTVRWQEVCGLEVQSLSLSSPARTKYILKDSKGNPILDFTDFNDGGNSDSHNSDRLTDYITEMMEPTT